MQRQLVVMTLGVVRITLFLATRVFNGICGIRQCVCVVSVALSVFRVQRPICFDDTVCSQKRSSCVQCAKASGADDTVCGASRSLSTWVSDLLQRTDGGLRWLR